MRFVELDRLGIGYEIQEHSSVFSCEDVVKILNVPMNRVVKTLILTDGNDVFAVVIRGDKKVRTSDIKRIFGKKLSFLRADAVERMLNQPVGALSPLLLEMEIAVDEDLNTEEHVLCGTGSNTHTLKIKGKDLIKVLSKRKCLMTKMGDSNGC